MSTRSAVKWSGYTKSIFVRQKCAVLIKDFITYYLFSLLLPTNGECFVITLDNKPVGGANYAYENPLILIG